MPRQLVSPYGAKTDSLIRVQTWVSVADRDALRSVATVYGFESYMAALFYHSIASFITTNNLTYADRAQLQSFVESLPAVIQASGERHFAHVPGGDNPSHQRTPSEPNQPANDGQVPSSGGGFGRGGKRASASAKTPSVSAGKLTQTSGGA